MTASNRLRRVTTDIGIAILVIGGVLTGSLVVEHFSRGEWHASVMQFQRGLWVFLGTVTVYMLLERMMPAGPHKSVKALLLNLQVNMLYLVTGALAGVLAALLAGTLSRRFDLGWIDLRFAEGKGVVALIGAMFLFFFVFDFFYYCSRLPQYRDRNFAAFFPLWDVLFGTYFAPARDEFPPTGVDGEKEFRSLGEATILPFREWSRMYRAWRLRRKLMLESILHE